MEFFDTNILVYAVDKGERQRRPMALELVRRAMQAQSFVISTQVMLEFYAVALRRRLMEPALATELLREWAGAGAVSTTPESLWHAFELQQRFGFSIWDAMIVQAALDAHCEVLYSEDLQAGQQIGPLRIVNPFRPQGVHEPAPKYAAAPLSAEPVDKLLRRAIRGKRLVSLMYDGLLRIGEPHDYGSRKGKDQLNFYQTAGASKTGRLPSWRTLDVRDISEVKLLEGGFGGTRSTRTQRHLDWDEVYASVTPGLGAVKPAKSR
jgi:predicted nucleic acid-binding protein